MTKEEQLTDTQLRIEALAQATKWHDAAFEIDGTFNPEKVVKYATIFYDFLKGS